MLKDAIFDGLFDKIRKKMKNRNWQVINDLNSKPDIQILDTLYWTWRCNLLEPDSISNLELKLEKTSSRFRNYACRKL